MFDGSHYPIRDVEDKELIRIYWERECPLGAEGCGTIGGEGDSA